MTHPRPFRFGVQLSTAPDSTSWTDLARRAEDLGYSTIFMPDHFGEQLSPTVVYCAGGYRSSVAASTLRAHGFTTVADLLGGYGAWAAGPG